MTLNFLDTVRHLPALHEADPELPKRIAEVRNITLRAMAHGGLFDQFGGGFARYSVDAHWLIPHFEKMLYDNALLLEAYTRAWVETQEPLYAAVVAETINWLEREMSAPGGGFYAALDADSDGEEGRYYVWHPEEIDSVLGPSRSREVRAAYNITPGGNFENGSSNPALVEPDFARREELAPAREALRQHRESTRTPPGRDPKICLAWNALMIRALAEAGFYFNQAAWLRRARAAADFIWDAFRAEAEHFRLHSVYYENSGSSVEAFLHDYALAAEAFLALAAKIDTLEPGVSAIYLERAQACIDIALHDFIDPQAPGYFFTAKGAETPVTRRKEWFDNAQPSGNSSLLHACSALYALTGEARYADALRASRPVYADYAAQVASGVAHGLEALATETRGIAHFKAGPAADLNALRAVLLEHPWQRVFITVGLTPEGAPDSTLQLCIGTKCFPPAENPAKIIAFLQPS